MTFSVNIDNERASSAEFIIPTRPSCRLSNLAPLSHNEKGSDELVDLPQINEFSLIGTDPF
jgi:hypothetical protein